MVRSKRRAVVTGIGVICPIGLDSESYWESLCARRSGVRRIQAFDPSGLPVRIAGEVPDFDAKQFIDKKERKSLRVMARTIQLAVAAAQLTMDHAGIDKSQIDPTRFGVEFGASLIATELEEIGAAAQVASSNIVGDVDLTRWGSQGLASIPPLWMLKYLPNMLACHVSILHNAQGPNNTITESDVASLLALGEAFRILERDGADLFLTGGGESRINPLSMVRKCLFNELSTRNDEPERACRPFDRGRDGMVLGEGAGVLVLEALEHAQRRQARIFAELVGFGSSFDRERSGAGLARAIQSALAEAEIKPDEIDHINAQGTSTVAGDIWEARGLQQVFGNCAPAIPVFAPKSNIGNLGAGSGVVEAIASILALEHGQLPATLNYEERDPACPLAVSAGDPRPVTEPYFLKIGFTEIGQCAAAVFKKWS